MPASKKWVQDWFVQKDKRGEKGHKRRIKIPGSSMAER